MGRIDRIITENFKSYQGKQVIGPFKSFTAVIGPNGAGKSNLMDAICFVVGLSARSLRGEKMRDLVFSGVEGKIPRTASVTLSYITDADEVEGYKQGEKMEFSRTINPAGSSVYRLNGEELTADEYSEALASINVMTKARNFLVFQGDVESVASKNPQDMMKHFEIFCGSFELKEDFETALKALHEVRTESANKAAKRRVTLQERKAVKAEKDEADKYLALRESRDNMRIQLALFRLYSLESRIADEESKHESLQKAASSLEEAQDGESSATTAVQDAAKVIAKLQKELSAKEKALSQLEKEALRSSSLVDEVSADISNASARCDELAGRMKKLAAEAEKRGTEITALESEIADLEAKLDDLEHKDGSAASKGSKDKSAPVAFDAAHRAEHTKLKGQVLQATAELRIQLEKLNRDQASDEALISSKRGTVDGLDARKADLSRRMSHLNSRKTELEAGQVRAVAERRNKEKELQETRLQLLDAQKRYEGISSELLEVKSTISAHRENRARTENDRKMEQAVEDMKRLFPGVRGRLVDLVSPAQKSVKTAVSVALGKHMDSVVVNSEAVVHECIAWLRENKVRPFTFLPLDSLRPEELDESVVAAIRTYKSRSAAAAFRLAKDCLRYDPEIEPAVQYACGSTVIADTLADAKELRFKRDLRAKVVSLDGTMIAKNGNMTGGISASDRDLDRQSKWDEKELRNAQTRRDELLAEEELLKRKVSKARTAAAESFVVLLEDMETALNTHNTKLNVMVKELENTAKLIGEASAELAAVEKQLKESRPERDAAKVRMEERSAQQAEIQAEMDSISENAFRDFAARLGLADMRDYETQVVARHEAEIKAKKQITELLSKLRSKLDYERDRLAKNSPEAVGKELEREKARTLELKSKEKDAKKSAETARAEMDTLRSELSKIKQSLKDADHQKDKCLKDKRAASDAKAALAKTMTSIETALDRLRSQRHEVLQKAQMEEIKVPTKAAEHVTGTGRRKSRTGRQRVDHEEEAPLAGSSSLFSQSMSVTSTTEEAPDTQTAADDQRRADRVDFSQLEDDYKETEENEEEVAHRLERKIHDLDMELNRLTPNLKAAGQLADVEAKLKVETDEYDECRTRCTTVENTFRNLKQTRTKKFMDAFNHVQKIIDIVYKELTRSSTHPMGGKASLSLTQEEDIFEKEDSGIKYDVMPPGKRFRELEMLSGGEKTVAALALIFGLHSFQPSPFFVMDEIDAALDNHNVQKVATYIRRRAVATESEPEPSMQAIVISLKDGFYDQASALVGIYRDASQNCSRALTMDLERFSNASATVLTPGSGYTR